jgi:Ino eighty subunit 1
MAVNPTVAALMSEWVSPPSSPAHHEDSFMTAATEDDDMGMMATPEPSEKHPRGKKRGRGDDANGNNPIGKIRHLKKNDGEPLWRKDIQFDFLKAVFDNDAKEFTNSYEKDRLGKQCFADLYIDTMSRSSKTSKVLRDKLLSDREAAKGMAMVCLLVNIGRMNTTLNCTLSSHPCLADVMLTTMHSLPRDASPTANLPRHSLPSSPPGPARL